MAIKTGQILRLKINNVVGFFRVSVVNDVTKSGQADWLPHGEGEQLLEVRWMSGPMTGRYTFCRAGDLF